MNISRRYEIASIRTPVVDRRLYPPGVLETVQKLMSHSYVNLMPSDNDFRTRLFDERHLAQIDDGFGYIGTITPDGATYKKTIDGLLLTYGGIVDRPEISFGVGEEITLETELSRMASTYKKHRERMQSGQVVSIFGEAARNSATKNFRLVSPGYSSLHHENQDGMNYALFVRFRIPHGKPEPNFSGPLATLVVALFEVGRHSSRVVQSYLWEPFADFRANRALSEIAENAKK